MTIVLDEDIEALMRQYADAHSLNGATAELLRRGLASSVHAKEINGVHVFDLPRSSPMITTEHVREIESLSE